MPTSTTDAQLIHLSRQLSFEPSDCHIQDVYWLRLTHDPSGVHPALLTCKKKMVICTCRKLANEIWQHAPEGESEVITQPALIVIKNEQCYFLDVNHEFQNTIPHTITSHTFAHHLIEISDEPFRWSYPAL